MARNIELKARLIDLPAARVIAKRLATSPPFHQRQVDTYFHCPCGRLKLREIQDGPAQLVWYQRPDQTDSKASDYLLVDVPQPDLLKQALAGALGIRVVVDKRREIYLHHHVRIHLDEVADLGTFLEFEAVLNPALNDAAGQQQVAQLARQFGIARADLIAGSYCDLLLSGTAAAKLKK